MNRPNDQSRPDPEALLQLAARETRGKLTIFLGMAPGVGKTYAMLERARALKAKGVDVVIGLVETHGRSETAALADDLEQLPRLGGQGAYGELDIDAALRRRPQLLIVDELAHSNPAGARHPKRHQDIAELIAAGIDVWTALNIQHLESLSDLVARTHGIANRPQASAWCWRELPVPVICAMHGVAYGGGLQVALGADMRFATADAKLSVMEIKWGLVPDVAGTQLLRHLCRDDVVRDLTYTGRVVSGEEAAGLGLITRIEADPRAAALATAREIAAKNPHAIRAAKRLLNAATVISPAEGLMMESVEQQAILGSPNQIEAVIANMEKRPPRFAD